MALGFLRGVGSDSCRRRNLYVRRLAAGRAALVGIDNLAIQFFICAAVSIGLTAASRTIFVNYFSRERTGQSLRTGVDSLPGKIGTVVSSSRGAMQEGAVKVFGSTWTAFPAEGESA